MRGMRLELVTIPAGAFAMGSVDGQPDEQPVHEVWVDEFALAIHPVTNREYRLLLEATGHHAPGMLADPRFHLQAQPVVMVSWFDAVAYCEWLARVTGRPCRLPTEAEREKAALGGARGIRYPWGDADARGNERHDRPQVVGLDSPNGLGLHNMGDLVHEWCSDWYDADYYRHSPARNPSGPQLGTRRSSRGGSWRHQVCVTRCAARSSIPPDRTYADYGFRVAVGAV
jgi:formylglycine-generating enzyme required for sulfatase activity